MKHYDVLILGGGIIGSSILYRLTQSGITNCLLVDRGKIADETTGASAGMVRVFHSDPLLCQMSAETMRTLSTFQGMEYQKTGAISILPEKYRRYSEQLAGYLNAAKYPAEILDAASAANRFPQIQFKPRELVFYEPTAGSIDPRKLSRCLVDASKAQGAEIIETCGDVHLTVHAHRIVGAETSNKAWRAKIVVNATGPWAEKLSCSVGAPLGTKLKAIQTNYFDWEDQDVFPCIFDYHNLSYSSCRARVGRDARHLLIGIGLSEERLDVAGHADYSKADLDKALKVFTDRVPSISGARWIHSRRWMDAYSLQKRGNLGFVPGYEGLMAAYGWGGTGIKLSQGIAMRATALLREQLQKQKAITPNFQRGKVCEAKTFTTVSSS